jgi:hypothetical protein
MKKDYLFAAGILLLSTNALAQFNAEADFLPIQKLGQTTRDLSGFRAEHRDPGDFLVCDDFSAPETWSIYTLDDTDPEWEIVSSEPADLVDYVDEMTSTTEANGFAAFNGIQYLLAGDVPPQNAVIEYAETIDCSAAAGVSLRFEQAYRAFNTDRTFVEVTAGDWDTDPILSVELNTSVPTNGPTIQEIFLVDISEIAAGESNIRVRFRWEELGGDDSFGAGYAWYIDDFCVQESWNYDQDLTTAFHRSGMGLWMEDGMGYYNIPVDQITEIAFSGATQNMGALIQTGAKVNVDVTGIGTFSGTSPTIDLGVGENDTLTVSELFTPGVGLGNYDFTYFVDRDNPEEETVNDTIYDQITITDWIYSRDNGFSTSSISNTVSNAGSPLLIGNVFDVFENSPLGGVDIAVTSSPTNVGQLIFAQIMVFDPTAGAFVYATQTEDHEISAGENGGFIRLFLNPDDHLELEAGQTVLVLAGHYGGADEVEFRMAQPVEEQTVLGYTSGATDPFFLSDPSSIMVRPLMTSFIGLDEEEALSFKIGNNQPNPFSQLTAINYELSEGSEVVLEITDLSGRLIQRINRGYQEIGAYNLEINGQHFENGTYFYTFILGNKRICKRMMVSH